MPAILTGALFLMVVGLIATLMYQPTPESNSEGSPRDRPAHRRLRHGNCLLAGRVAAAPEKQRQLERAMSTQELRCPAASACTKASQYLYPKPSVPGR